MIYAATSVVERDTPAMLEEKEQQQQKKECSLKSLETKFK